VIITAVISLFVGMLFAFGGEPTPRQCLRPRRL
jgi:hypothetical protein